MLAVTARPLTALYLDDRFSPTVTAVANVGDLGHYANAEPRIRQAGGHMGTRVAGSMALIVALAVSGICSAQVVVKKEPMEGQLRTGATVLVDDGTCGQGKIKLISSTGGNGNEIAGLPPRTRTCVPRAALR